MQSPIIVTYLKYLSIFNFGYDVLIINQWRNVTSLHCEFDVEALCLSDGRAVLNEIKMNPVIFLFNVRE